MLYKCHGKFVSIINILRSLRTAHTHLMQRFNLSLQTGKQPGEKRFFFLFKSRGCYVTIRVRWNSHFIWETLTGTNFLSCSIANSLRDFVEERYYSFTTHYMQFIFPVSRKQITLGTRFPTDRDLRKEVGKKVHEKEIELPRNCNDSERDDSVKSRTSSYSCRTFETV